MRGISLVHEVTLREKVMVRKGMGLGGGIEIGLGGLGVENIDGKVEKGGQRPYVISTHAEAHILTD